MKRAQIIKNGIVTNQAEMEEAELLAWVEKGTQEHWFGRPAKYEERFNTETNEFESVLVEEAEAFEVVITDITAELEQNKVNQEAQQLLNLTDWLIIRELDEGTPCPAEIKQARAEARARIVK